MSVFRMPVSLKITGRLSRITNAFVNSIIPAIQPTEEEVETALDLLGMTLDDVECSYCGNPATEWDHLRPIVRNRRPTGYISEIRNLVPACGKCNQSKGNKDWRAWMLGPARLSPATRGIPDLEDRIARLEAYEAWGDVTKLDVPAIVGEEGWTTHILNLEKVEAAMREAQAHSADLRKALRAKVGACPSEEA